MLVNNFLEISANRFPDKIALITSEARYTYRELDEMANKVAHALLADGLTKWDRVAVFMDNSAEAVVSIFGILKAGGIFLIINPTTKAEKLIYLLNNCRAHTLISSQKNLSVIADVCNNVSSLRCVFLEGAKTNSTVCISKKTTFLTEILSSNMGYLPRPHTIDMDLATIIYTSGSTGLPKGVMMTHFNMVSAANSITEYLENTSEDIILNVLPLSFDYGLYQVLMGFKMGATVILEKTFVYPYKVIETILKEGVTGFPIVPTISAILLQMEDLKRHRFEHLRYISNTGAALPVAHIQKIREFFPKTKLYSMYGLTECKRVSYLSPEELDIRPTSVGRGMPNTEIYIVDEGGNRVTAGIVGELVVRGSNVMRGYWEMPAETAKKLRPGTYPGELVLYTGDLFKMDKEGYLYFIGRRDDIIKSRGEKVSPKEIENVLYEIDGVVEVAVVGVYDELLGEAVKAFIALKDGVILTEKDIMRFCSQHMEDFMVPKYIEFRKELPKTDTGKIKKTGLG